MDTIYNILENESRLLPLINLYLRKPEREENRKRDGSWYSKLLDISESLPDVLTNYAFGCLGPKPPLARYKVVERTLDDLVLPGTNQVVNVGIIATRTSGFGSDCEGISSALIAAAHSKKYAVVVAPEYSFLPESGKLTLISTEKFKY